MVVEVAREVDDEPRLPACLDDDMQRLYAKVVGRVCGAAREADDSAEVHVLAQAFADDVGVLGDGRRIGV